MNILYFWKQKSSNLYPKLNPKDNNNNNYTAIAPIQVWKTVKILNPRTSREQKFQRPRKIIIFHFIGVSKSSPP